MAKINSKVLGISQEVKMLPAHFLSKSFDVFLKSDEVNRLIEAIILLSIGIETYIKSSLEKKVPTIINRLDHNRWNNIKLRFGQNQAKAEKRNLINQTIMGYSELPKTLDYGIALEVFPIYYSIPSKVLEDLKKIKDYRNGLFHWKAPIESGLTLTRQCIRVFEWIFKFIERKNGWWLGNEFNIIDPQGKKRDQFRQLKRSIRSETLLILQRRIFYHNEQIQIISQLEAKKSDVVFIPNAIKWPEQKCAACNSNKFEIHWQGISFGKRETGAEHYLECKNCGFYCSGTEFEVLKPKGFPALKEVVDEKLKQL
ncbi:MAG: hypothetical protein H6688_02260 [Erysipelotrichaceae bacterium]|nr:hypothetical protein [candidate division KSB1 bacterium]MCB9498266.1 hypothetical protein [Erysipelotrichaceae bacterium]